MKQNLKPISPWGSISSMLGARIRLEKLQAMILRSAASHCGEDCHYSEIEGDLEYYVMQLEVTIDQVYHAAFNRAVEERDAREAAKKAKHGPKQ